MIKFKQLVFSQNFSVAFEPNLKTAAGYAFMRDDFVAHDLQTING